MVLGLDAIIGLAQVVRMATANHTGQEVPMGRKVDVLGARSVALEGVDLPERENSLVPREFALRDQLIFSGSTDWSPEQAEQYIDWRIQVVDSEIAHLREQLDDRIALRKRWLAVTGGRSKIFPNGNGNGNGNGLNGGA